jgi:hypothetical protein
VADCKWRTEVRRYEGYDKVKGARLKKAGGRYNGKIKVNGSDKIKVNGNGAGGTPALRRQKLRSTRRMRGLLCGA